MSTPPAGGDLHRDVIVIGGSAGSIAALRQVVETLPADLPAAVFVVVHMRAEGTSLLHVVLGRDSSLPTRQALDGDAVRAGVITVAVPDRHLILDHGLIRNVHGPRENRARPSVDVLFRSAALSYGTRVIGVVLSGTLDDGASGIAAIKRHGGIAIVQDPEDAQFPSMPVNALENVQPDHMVPASAMGALLAQLVSEKVPVPAVPAADEVRAAEVRMAKGDHDEMERIGRPSIFTCPECTGVLWEVDEPEVLRFRCRVGHAYTAESLIAGQEETQEAAIWAGIRALEENAKLSERLARRFRDRNQPTLAKRMAEKARIANNHADAMRAMVTALPDTGVVTEES